jgi:hypothetical protein
MNVFQLVSAANHLRHEVEEDMRQLLADDPERLQYMLCLISEEHRRARSRIAKLVS